MLKTALYIAKLLIAMQGNTYIADY